MTVQPPSSSPGNASASGPTVNTASPPTVHDPLVVQTTPSQGPAAPATSDAVSAAKVAAWGGIVVGVLAALTTIGCTFITNFNQDDTQAEVAKLRQELPASDLSSVRADQVIRVNGKTNERFSGATVPIEGKVLHTLPSGVTIWVVSQLGDSGTTATVPPKGSVGVDAGGPCAVDMRSKVFDCGDVYLGSTDERASYDLFVGLVAPSEAKELMRAVIEQNCYQPTYIAGTEEGLTQRTCKEKYDHAVPRGIEWLPPIQRTRS